MTADVTKGIKVSVRARYSAQHSDVRSERFVFVYDISISNHSERTVQLLRRQWRIVDSLADVRHVEGPGVVGETPILAPGEEFGYNSMCELSSRCGRMEGSYTMMDRESGRRFIVKVPPFDLLVDWMSN